MDIDRLPTPARQEYEASRTSILNPAFNVTEAFQLTEQVVCGLFGHVDPLGQIARTYPIRMGIHHHIEKSLVEITKTLIPQDL